MNAEGARRPATPLRAFEGRAADRRGADDGPAPVRPVDGRSAIRDRNRDAVLDAVLALFSEDNLSPGPEEVALRVGLSVRSVYRYFEDQDALVRAAIERHTEQLLPLSHIERIGQGDLEGRIERFATSRLRLYEASAATQRASRLRASFDPLVRRQLEVGRIGLRQQLDRHFAPELESLDLRTRRSRAAALDALTQHESLDHYRLHRRFSARETRLGLMDALAALLRP